MEILEPPKGCMEIGGFILVVEIGKKWYTKDGRITEVWQERGIWDSPRDAQKALMGV